MLDKKKRSSAVERLPIRFGFQLGTAWIQLAALLFAATPAVSFGQASGVSARQKFAAADRSSHAFEIVIAIYPGGTLLDFAGPSEVFHRLPNTTVRFASLEGGPVTLEYGVVFGKTEKLSDIQNPDLLLVPGGPDLRAPMNPKYLNQIRRLANKAKHVTSVCTGSFVLAAAGVLESKRSASHWALVNRLANYGAIPVSERFVEDDNGRFMSGGGVTSGIDFALRVAERISGKDAAELAQLMIEYDPDPPFKSGHPREARPEILRRADEELPGASRGLALIPGVR